MNLWILSKFFMPGASSTPEDTSTPKAPLVRIASATFSGDKPPAKNHGLDQVSWAISSQSNAFALPPGRIASLGGLASNIKKSATAS